MIDIMAQSQQVFAPGRDDQKISQHPVAAAEHAALIQSRETGGVTPDELPMGQVKALPFATSWIHFMAGGIGGMTAAALTAPLDVLKTRLQSDLYQAQLRASRASYNARAPVLTARNPISASFYHLSDTLHILRTVRRTEGSKALFKGLGPNLVGVIPARAIHFYVYGNGKRVLAERCNRGQEAPWVHMMAAAAAGIATATATNPIWLIKTRMQLDKNIAQQQQQQQLRRNAGGAATAIAATTTGATPAARAATATTQMHRKYRNSFDCVKQVLRQEGIYGLYKGMSASYLGVAESTLQWVLYEQLKGYLARREERIETSGRDKTIWDRSVEWTGRFGAAGAAKFVAAILAYPHEVARTRMRQAPMANGRPKYTGLWQCFKLVWKEEGVMGLYGGLTPHLLRTVPSAAIMFAMYEGILRLCNTPA